MMPEQRKFISEKLYSGKLKLMAFWYTFVDNLVWLSAMLTWEKSNGFAHKVSKQNHLMNIFNFNFLWLFAFNILILSISGHQHCYNILSILILINACHYCNKIACNQYLLKISHGSFHTYAPLVIIQWWWSTSLFTLHLKSVITHHQELFFNPRTSVFFCPLQLDFLEMLWLFYIFVYSKFHHHQLHISMPSNWG